METPKQKLGYAPGELVFAKCKGFRPWPGEVVEVAFGKVAGRKREEYIYRVRFFSSPAAETLHCEAELEKFD
jgi:hypothetical protein